MKINTRKIGEYVEIGIEIDSFSWISNFLDKKEALEYVESFQEAINEIERYYDE